ncbi:MAG: hypothetical protein QXJ11_03495 [Candidatus Bathyarchaeia archaeon]
MSKKRRKRVKLNEIEKERELLILKLLKADLEELRREKEFEEHIRKKRVDYVR